MHRRLLLDWWAQKIKEKLGSLPNYVVQTLHMVTAFIKKNNL